jgi:hypothetical protein
MCGQFVEDIGSSNWRRYTHNMFSSVPSQQRLHNEE